MTKAKFNTTLAASILCFSLLATITPPKIGADSSRAVEPFDAGEWVEAPANSPLYLSLGGVGTAMLSGGAKARLATFTTADHHALLVATLVSGDLVVNLEQQSSAYVNTGKTIFAAAPGSLFHTGLRGDNAFFDTSDTLRDRLGDWMIRVPALTSPTSPVPGDWTIRVPAPVSPEPSRPEPVKPVIESKARNFNFATSAHTIGRVESIGAIKINQTAVANHSLLRGSELIQAPDGASARATLNGIAQVTLAGGSQARLMTPSVGGAEGDRILAATLLSGSLVVQLDPSIAGYAEAAGSTFLASRGARFRAMLVEGRAIFEMIEGVGFKKGEWALDPQPISELIKKITQDPAQSPASQIAQRRYIVRPVGLNSNLVIRARSTRQIQVRVTDEDDRPVTGVPIIFSLGSPGAGAGGIVGSFGSAAAASSNERTFTDAQGIASVNFVAADIATTGSISATVEGTNYSWVGQINLLKVTPGFWSPQNAVPVMVTAATAVTIGTIKAATKEDKLPVQPVGSTIIKP